METIIERLEKHLSTSSPKWQFPHLQSCCTLGELDDWGRACAERLQSLGVGAGTPVGLALNNGPAYVALLIGIWRLNAVAVPLRPYAGKGFGYAEYLHDVDRVCDLHNVIRDPEVGGDPFDEWAATTGKPVMTEQDFDRRLPTEADTETTPCRADDIAVLQMTSGTTSRPKAVVVTHDMVMRQLAYLSSSGELYAGTTVASAASWLPMNHDMGLFTGVLWPIYDGSDNLLSTPAFFMRNPKRWVKLLGDAAVTMNFATNTSAVAVCNTIERARDADTIDLAELHLYFGAEKLNADVLRRTIATLAPLGLDASHIHVGYGMAENALAATRSPRGRPREILAWFGEEQRVVPVFGAGESENLHALVSVGEPMPGYRFEILDPEGRELGDLRIGEVHLAGPCLTPGYYRDPEQTRKAIDNGLFRTGDLGFMHDGELYFIGRRDDVVNIGGRKLIPDDIEHTVEQLGLPGCGRTCLLGIERDESGLTTPLLLVEFGGKHDVDVISQIAAGIRAELLEHYDLLVGDILVCAKGSVEKTSSGKKRRKVIRQRYLDGEFKRAKHELTMASLPRELQA